MHEMFSAPSAAAAETRLDAIERDLDTLIGPPTPSHPLWSIIEAHRAEVEQTLNTYSASAATRH
jgi:hypothetical protein